MKTLKKYITLMLAVFLLISMQTISVNAKNISSVTATEENGVVTVSGTAEAGTLACAIFVYDSTGTTLMAMETCGVNDDSIYSYTMKTTLKEGTYVVKVADYDGGAYASTNLAVKAALEEDSDNSRPDGSIDEKDTTGNDNAASEKPVENDNVPETDDNSPAVVYLVIAAISGIGVFSYCSKYNQ